MGLIRGFGEALQPDDRREVRLLGSLISGLGESVQNTYAIIEAQSKASYVQDMALGKKIHMNIWKMAPKNSRIIFPPDGRITVEGQGPGTSYVNVQVWDIKTGQKSPSTPWGGAKSGENKISVPPGQIASPSAAQLQSKDEAIVVWFENAVGTPTLSSRMSIYEDVDQSKATVFAEKVRAGTGLDVALTPGGGKWYVQIYDKDKTAYYAWQSKGSPPPTTVTTDTATQEAFTKEPGPPQTAWDKFVSAMTAKAVPPVPNGVWVGTGIAVVVGVTVAVASMKKK